MTIFGRFDVRRRQLTFDYVDTEPERFTRSDPSRDTHDVAAMAGQRSPDGDAEVRWKVPDRATSPKS